MGKNKHQTEMKSVARTDKYSEVDLLGADKYYTGLAKFITRCETPLTIAIQGDWGSGKTTALRLVQKKIEEADGNKNPTVWFDTWQYSKFGNESNMTFSLLSNLKMKLEEVAKKNGLEGKGNSKAFKDTFPHVMKTALKMFAESTSTEILRETVGKAINAALDLDQMTDMASDIANMKNEIQAGINEIIKEDERLVIFIDDLDRLEPKVLMELLESMKIFLDCDRCVYVIAVDSKVVEQAVKSKYGDMMGDEKAKQFFDKIIQVPYNLPTEQYNLNSYINQFVKKNDTETLEKYVQVIKTIFGEKSINPRQIKRAFNLFDLYKFIAKDIFAKEQIDEIYLLALIVFQMADENAYKELVAAVNNSDDKVGELLLQPEYDLLRRALNLDQEQIEKKDDFDGAYSDFISLVSQIAQSSSNKQVIAEMESFMEKINLEKKNLSVNKTVINEGRVQYEYEDGTRSYLLTKGNDNAINLSVNTRSHDIKDLSEKYPETLICLSNNKIQKVDSDQLGYYDNEWGYTFVGIGKCTNEDLVNEILAKFQLSVIK